MVEHPGENMRNREIRRNRDVADPTPTPVALDNLGEHDGSTSRSRAERRSTRPVHHSILAPGRAVPARTTGPRERSDEPTPTLRTRSLDPRPPRRDRDPILIPGNPPAPVLASLVARSLALSRAVVRRVERDPISSAFADLPATATPEIPAVAPALAATSIAVAVLADRRTEPAAVIRSPRRELASALVAPHARGD